MPSFPIVKFDPPADDIICLLDIFEVVMPDAFFFDRSKKPFDHSVIVTPSPTAQCIIQKL